MKSLKKSFQRSTANNMKHISYRIPPHLNGCKIKNIIRQELGISSAVLTQLKKYPEGIMLNGKSVFSTCSASAGDILELTLRDKTSQNIVPMKMDLDILYYDDKIINDDDLIVPHPRLHQRRFTLLPLCDISADFEHPIFKKTNKTLLEECQDTSEVSRQDTKTPSL